MKAAAFDYIKAKNLVEAISLLKEYGEDARLIAGGQTLLATLNLRLSEPSILIDITAVSELKGISVQGNMLRIGALVTHTEIESSDLIAQHAPLLKEAAPHIAHRAIRNLGTWGGSLAYGDPAAEWPACSLALDAVMVIQGPSGIRRVSAKDFFIDLYTTALEEDEILVASEIPLATTNQSHCFQELARRHGDYAAVGLAAMIRKDRDKVQTCRLAFFSVAAIPTMASKAQAFIEGKSIDAVLIQQAVNLAREEIETLADITNSQETKTHLLGVLLERALTKMMP
jgi:carbon-monoxide dehydrogenase medium subunit